MKSLSKLMDETLTSFPTIFVNKIVKKWDNSHIKVVSQLSIFLKWNRENQLTESLYRAIGKDSWVGFQDSKTSPPCYI